MAGLNVVRGIIDLNGQRGPIFDQDPVFGYGDLLNAFFLALEHLLGAR
jgi:xylose isomerase